MAQLKIDLVLNKIQAMTGLRSFESNVMTIGKRLAGFVGVGGGIAGITATIQGLLDKASRLQDLSDAFNVSAESIQRLGNVASTSNVSLEEIGSKLGKLAKAAQEARNGNEELQEAFGKVGVSLDELATLSPEQLFDRLREAVQSGKLAGDEFAVVGKLLAKDFQRLMPILRMTAEEFANLAAAGGVMSDAVVTQLDAANISLRLFQENISKRLATATADVLNFFKIIKEQPKLALELFFAGDIKAIEKFSKEFERQQKGLREQIQAERKARAGDPLADEVESKEGMAKMDKEAKREADFELDLIEARIDGRKRAEKILEDFEERTAEERIRQAEQRAREVAGITEDVESLVAEREGPRAELELQKRRAAEAAQAARETGTPEQILEANQEANRLQRMLQSDLESRGFGRQALSRARMQAEQVTGMVPGVNALRDIATKPDVSQPQKIQVEQLPLEDVLKRLDDLIRAAGRFS